MKESFVHDVDSNTDTTLEPSSMTFSKISFLFQNFHVGLVSLFLTEETVTWGPSMTLILILLRHDEFLC